VKFVPAVQNTASLLTQLQSGNPPDVFHALAGYSDPVSVFPLASQGKLLDLTGSPWIKRTLPDIRRFLSLKGKMYGMPVSLAVAAIPYNMDVLKSLGIQGPPASWSEVMALCQKAKAAGKVAYALGFGSTSITGTWMQVVMAEDVYVHDPYFTSKRNAGKVKFISSPYWRESFQELVDMKNAGCFQPLPEATSLPQGIAMVATGASASNIGTTGIAALIYQVNPTANIQFAPLPAPDDPKNTTVSYVLSPNLVASARTAEPSAAKTFINFIARPKQSELYAKVQGGLAPYDLAKGMLPPALQPLAALIKAGHILQVPYAAWPDPAIYLNGIRLSIAGLFTGQRSVDDLLNGLDTLWDQAIAARH
jgi:raffinose/stachyose/melibiose transport system substrate-binding protein